MRVLVASTGGAGHFGPLVPFVEAFLRRGDDVLAVVPPSLAATAEATGACVAVGATAPADEVAAIWARVQGASADEAAVLVNREVFGRLGTAAMLPAMTAACQEWRPDLVLREPCEYASAVAAERAGVRQAQVGISTAAVEASSFAIAEPALLPHGDDIVALMRISPYLTRFPASLDPSPFPTTRRFRETTGPAGTLPDWWDGDDRPLVYATLGSVAGRMPTAAAAYRAVLDAVAAVPARVLLTVGRSVDVATLGPVPVNTHVEAWVPQADVLPVADVVLCHGGSGTTFGALAGGVPLVVVPMFADQPANGRLVAGAGAGVVVAPDRGPDDAVGTFGPSDVPRIRAAVESVLGDPCYRQAATGIAEEMRTTPDVADLVAELAG